MQRIARPIGACSYKFKHAAGTGSTTALNIPSTDVGYEQSLIVSNITGSYVAIIKQEVDNAWVELDSREITATGLYTLEFTPTTTNVKLDIINTNTGSYTHALRLTGPAGWKDKDVLPLARTYTICDRPRDSYRFGFNGKEKDNEFAGIGNFQDYGFREHDTRIGRFNSVDPLTKSYPWYTPYQFAGNTPIQAIDLDGAEEYIVNSAKDRNGRVTSITVTTYTKVNDNKKLNMEFLQNGTSQKNYEIASFGVRTGEVINFKNEFTRLEDYVLKNGVETKENRYFEGYKNQDGSVISKDWSSQKLERTTRKVEFYNSMWLAVNDKNDLKNVLKNFNNTKGYKLKNVSDKISMYNIAAQSQYKAQIETQIKKLGITDDQINWLEDLPSDGDVILKYSIGTPKATTNAGSTNLKIAQ